MVEFKKRCPPKHISSLYFISSLRSPFLHVSASSFVDVDRLVTNVLSPLYKVNVCAWQIKSVRTSFTLFGIQKCVSLFVLSLIIVWETGPESLTMVLLQLSTLVHSCAWRKQNPAVFFLFVCLFFLTWILSPQTFHVLSLAGNRASEGGDGEVGKGFVQGGHADGVWGPVLSLLVQPLLRAELQEPSRAHHGSTGGDHRRGRHRDTSGIVWALSQGKLLFWLKLPASKRGPLRCSRTRDVVWASLNSMHQHWMLFKSFF